MGLKLMYLAKRNPRFDSQAAFAPRWRQHGALAMSLPTWLKDRRYVHADAAPTTAAPANTYDGVGVMWPLGGSLHAPAGSPPPPKTGGRTTSEILVEDEMKAFDGPVMPVAVLTEEEVLRDGDVAGFTAYLWYNSVADAEAAVAKVTASPHAAGLTRIAISRVGKNPVSDNSTLTYKAILDLTAAEQATVETALKALDKPADVTVVAQNRILWDNGPAASMPAPAVRREALREAGIQGITVEG